MPAVKKMSVTLLFGVMAAVCMILFVLGTYLAGPIAFLGWGVWMGRAIVILLASVAAVVEKRARDGILDFRAALKVSYGVLVLGIVAEGLFVWLVLNVIDPHFYQRLIPVMLENIEKSKSLFKSADDLRQALNDITTQNQFSLGRVISGTGFELVGFFLIALLIAATVKAKKAGTKQAS
jgi:hypothetical protein